jgi:hypothetical protein
MHSNGIYTPNKALTVFFFYHSLLSEFRINKVGNVDRIHLALDRVQCQNICQQDDKSLGYKRLSWVAEQLSVSEGLLHE